MKLVYDSDTLIMVVVYSLAYLYVIGLQTANHLSIVRATVMYTLAHRVTGDIGYNTWT